ncbi:MAG: molecular chaperone TorD family protein [Acidobacteria bacterium]|nr:molecular chaperone TorD family protein [Acidobacteriota bacterium]
MKAKTDVTELFGEAAEWRLISLLFECPVGDWQAQVTGLAAEIADPQLKSAAEFAVKEASEGLYHSIFGPGGPAPAREVTYRSWVQPGYLLSELNAFYDAFGYQREMRETPDHIAVETGFMAYLKMKEAFAQVTDNAENADVTASAARTFNREHLAKMTEQIAKSLSFSGIEYLALASSSLLKRVGHDRDKKKRQILPVLGEADDSFFECG